MMPFSASERPGRTACSRLGYCCLFHSGLGCTAVCALHHIAVLRVPAGTVPRRPERTCTASRTRASTQRLQPVYAFRSYTAAIWSTTLCGPAHDCIPENYGAFC